MRSLLIVCTLLVLSACGGGGGSGSSDDKSSLKFEFQPGDIVIFEDEDFSRKLPGITGGIGTYTIQDLPDWMSFDAPSLTLAGVPGDAEAGNTYELKIVASHNSDTIISNTFTIEVRNINDAPYVANTKILIEEYAQEFEITLQLDDVDTEKSYLILENADIPASHAEVIGRHPDLHQVRIKILDPVVAINDGIELIVTLYDGSAWNYDVPILVTINGLPSLEFKGVVDHEAVEDKLFTYKPGLVFMHDAVRFSAFGLPEWLAIDERTGEISGTPLNEDAGRTYSNIKVTATDGNSEATSDEFSIRTVSVNDSPEILTESIAFNEHQERYEFDLDIKDEETSLADLDISVSSSNGYVNISRLQGGKFELTFNNAELALTELTSTFEVLVSDQPEHRVTKEIGISFSDSNDLTVFVNQNNVANSNSVADIVFNQPIPFDQIMNLYHSQCTGLIQLSANDFYDCVPVNAMSNPSGLSFDIQSNQLPVIGSHKLKISKDIQSVYGNSLEQDVILSFQRSNGLLITEVGGKEHYDAMHWFEVYNSTAEPIDLSNYKLRTRAIDSTTCTSTGCTVQEDYEFQLGRLFVQPGQYAIVRGNNWNKKYLDSDRITYVGDTLYPYWDNYGFIELISTANNTTEDIVIFGNWFDTEPSPTSNGAWSGSAFIDYSLEYQSGLARSENLADTNSSSDWVKVGYITPGGPNDISCYEDDDSDGIPDCAEVVGSTLSGISLYELGARRNQKDIFIEVDYMDSKDEGVIPRREALQKVVDAFATQGIAVHFDVGNLYDQAEGINPENFDLGGGNQVPISLGVGFDVAESSGLADLYDIKLLNFDLARLPVFHYMLMAYTQQADGSEGSSGLAEINGNDLIISLGNWGLNSDTDEALNTLINFQASTIMHELGHNLGLMHGGNEEVNYKPNYLSVMNYMYQLWGLPSIGNNEGDRYYWVKNQNAGSEVCGVVELTNSFKSDYRNFKLDYSVGENSYLHENGLNESEGLKLAGSSNVDFNCDGDINTFDRLDINFSGNDTDTLRNYNDWANIDLRFQRYYQGNFHGSSQKTIDSQPQDLLLVNDVIGNDKAKIAEEIAPSKTVMDLIRGL